MKRVQKLVVRALRRSPDPATLYPSLKHGIVASRFLHLAVDCNYDIGRLWILQWYDMQCTTTMKQAQMRSKNREERNLLPTDVAREWKVKKQASMFSRVEPTGILYMGYLHNETHHLVQFAWDKLTVKWYKISALMTTKAYQAIEIQLAWVRSQLRYVLSSGKRDARIEICSIQENAWIFVIRKGMQDF